MDYSFFQRKWFSKFERTEKRFKRKFIKKEIDSDFSNDVKKIFPDAVLLKIEEEN